MLDTLAKFRKTECYKICGWIGFCLCLLTVLLVLCAKGAGLAGLIYGLAFYGLCQAYIVACVVLTVLAIKQVKDNKIDLNGNIIADIGYVIPLIYFLYILYELVKTFITGV